jgi:sialic acid synthase SpsE
LREHFRCEAGLSDHTMGIGVAIASVALGATVIEKHFTLSRADGGVDSAFSMEPDEFARLVVECERAWQALGTVSYGATPDEERSRVFRRSLYVVKDMIAGEIFTAENVRAIRPGNGLPPGELSRVLGRAAAVPLARGTPLAWKVIS